MLLPDRDHTRKDGGSSGWDCVNTARVCKRDAFKVDYETSTQEAY